MKVTKWSTFTGDFNVTDQNSEQSSGGPGSVDAGLAVPHSSDAQSQPRRLPRKAQQAKPPESALPTRQRPQGRERQYETRAGI